MKKTISVLIVLMLFLSVLTGCVCDIWIDHDLSKSTEPPRQITQTLRHEAAETFAGGNGTEEDPFQISEPGHLVLLHELMQKGNGENNFDDIDDTYDTYVKGHYILTADIFLNDTADYDNWAEVAPVYGWESIGANLRFKSFMGSLDGNGHKIVGMYIDGDTSERVMDASGIITPGYGLFAVMRGKVKNLTVEQAYIRVSGGGASVGTIAGDNGLDEGAVIEGCTVSSVIELYDSCAAGGVIGVAYNGVVTSCLSDSKITQLDDASGNVGGISGYRGSIADCIFTGTLSGSGDVGGIIGSGDKADNCVNMGSVRGDRAGGIIGNSFEAGRAYEGDDLRCNIENCINKGRITGVSMAGGIVGAMSNSVTDISMSVINCENKGNVICDESAAGIIGQLSVERTGMIKVENCVNHVDITGKGKTGGIICNLIGGINYQEGEVVISGCKNLGSIISDDQYSAGIVTYFMVMGGETDLRLTVENCTNEGVIQSTSYAGGILGFSNVGFNAEVSADAMNISDDTQVTLRKCTNSGNITVNSSNAMTGGIVGVLGLGYIPTEITDCVNDGAVEVDFTLTDDQIASSQGLAWTEFYQIAGGIVGRVGDALKLSTGEGVKTSADNVNTASGNIKISGCSSTGAISAPDYSFILNSKDQPLYVNYLGGIIGQCSATDGYAFSVENCTYTGADRGLGDTAYSDVA